MNDGIRVLYEKIHALEGDLLTLLHEQETHALYKIKGRRVEFERVVQQAHRRFRVGFFGWLCSSRPRNVLSAPFIYAVFLPLFLLDISLTLYQAICFRLYRIPRVRKSEYISLDRHHLGYLNFMEKFNCDYCGYANGLMAYGREIIARTEQYWCPIKHARGVPGSHRLYSQFLEFGEASEYGQKLEEFRRKISD